MSIVREALQDQRQPPRPWRRLWPGCRKEDGSCGLLWHRSCPRCHGDRLLDGTSVDGSATARPAVAQSARSAGRCDARSGRQRRPRSGPVAPGRRSARVPDLQARVSAHSGGDGVAPGRASGAAAAPRIAPRAAGASPQRRKPQPVARPPRIASTAHVSGRRGAAGRSFGRIPEGPSGAGRLSCRDRSGDGRRARVADPRGHRRDLAPPAWRRRQRSGRDRCRFGGADGSARAAAPRVSSARSQRWRGDMRRR